MRKKIPFLALSLFAISCGGGGGPVGENSEELVSENTKVGELCKEVCRDINVDLNISYSGDLQNNKYKVNWGSLEFFYRGKKYHFNLCGFIWKGHQQDFPNPYKNCFLVELQSSSDNYCGEPKKILLYSKGRKIGEIEDGLADTYCSQVGAIHEHSFGDITINKFCYTECSKIEMSQFVPTKEGNLSFSINLPNKVGNRAIHSDTDFARIDVSSNFYSPESTVWEQYNLEPVYLSKTNSSATLKVPAGNLEILITLWDNGTNDEIPYPIGGKYIFTRVKEGETKNIIAYIPTGIWTLKQPIKGIKKIQVGAFPTNPEVSWGSPIPEYVTFNKDWYKQVISSNGTIEKPAIAGLLEQAFIETDNRTLYSFINQRWTINEFLNETNENYNEFTFYAWDELEGTKPNLLFGKFRNSTEVTLYSYDSGNCTVKFYYDNGTIHSFDAWTWDCLSYLPLSIFEQTGNINGTYTYNNVTAYTLENENYLEPIEQCIYLNENCIKVNRIDVSYSFQGVEKTEATITDLPLPWKDQAHIVNFNATCTDDGLECTYYWSINNPQNHPISCYLTDDVGNIKKEVNCSDGNFTCTSNTCLWPFQNTSLVVRDNSYVMPLADVSPLKEINYIASNKEILKDIPGINIQLNDVIDILNDDSNGTITIFKRTPVLCTIQQGDTENTFILKDCSNSSFEGVIKVVDSSDNGGVSIVTENETMPVIFAYKYYDRDAIVVNDDNQTIPIIKNLANATYYDNEFQYIVNGTWEIFRYSNTYSAWIRVNKECISFYSNNNTYVYSTTSLSQKGNYTISNGTLYLYGDINYNGTIMQVFFDPDFLIIANGTETEILKKTTDNNCY